MYVIGMTYETWNMANAVSHPDDIRCHPKSSGWSHYVQYSCQIWYTALNLSLQVIISRDICFYFLLLFWIIYLKALLQNNFRTRPRSGSHLCTQMASNGPACMNTFMAEKFIVNISMQWNMNFVISLNYSFCICWTITALIFRWVTRFRRRWRMNAPEILSGYLRATRMPAFFSNILERCISQHLLVCSLSRQQSWQVRPLLTYGCGVNRSMLSHTR